MIRNFMLIDSFRSNEGSTLENKLLVLNPCESSKTWIGKLQGLERVTNCKPLVIHARLNRLNKSFNFVKIITKKGNYQNRKLLKTIKRKRKTELKSTLHSKYCVPLYKQMETNDG